MCQNYNVWPELWSMRLHIISTCILVVLLLKMYFSASRCMNTDEARLVFQKYDEMMKLLHDYCTRVYTSWTSRVDVDCKFNLDQPLLLRDKEKNILSVNFNRQANAFHFHSAYHVFLWIQNYVITSLHLVIIACCSIAGGKIPHHSRTGRHPTQCSWCLCKAWNLQEVR